MELRIQIEARKDYFLPIGGDSIPNPVYDPKAQKYFEEIPDDVLVPEEDVERLKEYFINEEKQGRGIVRPSDA
jgi:rubredoxin